MPVQNSVDHSKILVLPHQTLPSKQIGTARRPPIPSLIAAFKSLADTRNITPNQLRSPKEIQMGMKAKSKKTL